MKFNPEEVTQFVEIIAFRKKLTFESKNSKILIPKEDLECGKCVIVKYENKLYPGEITEIGTSGFFVNVMEEEKIRGYFKWPNIKMKLHIK